MPGIQGDFDSLTTRQLRKECASRAIDLTGCFDKDAILQRLHQAVTNDRRRDAAGSHSDVASQKVPSEAPRPGGENVEDVAPSYGRAADAIHAQGDVGASQAPSAEAPRPGGENVEDVAQSHERAADAIHAQGDVGASQEPAAEAPRPGGEHVEDVDPSHERAADAIHAQGDVGASQEPAAEAPRPGGEHVEDVAPSHERAADAIHAQGDVGASQEPAAEAPRPGGEHVEDVAPSHERAPERPADSNIDIEDSNQFYSNEKWKVDRNKQLKTCAKWAASEEIAAAAKRDLALNSSKLADRSALEVIPMRALMKECKLMGLDVSGLYAKCEVIKKLLAELNRAAEEQLRFKMKEDTPCTNEELRGDTQIPKDLEAELLPHPTGPPIALSPFPKAVPEPARPVDPPPDPFEFLGNRVVEEETTAQDPPHVDLESDVEEIELEASPEATSPHQEVWKPPAVAPEVIQEEVPSCGADGADVVPEAPRPRASISELFRLPLEDLLLRCEAEGINVVPGESKGMLISRLKQAMSRSTEASRSVEEPDPPVPPAAETDTVAAAATAVPSAGPVPSLGPQVFHMASDESRDEGAGEDSDGDFFPDFPVRKEPEASANLEKSSWMAQDVKMADDAQPQTQAAGEEEPQQQRFENSEGASTFSAQPPVAPEKLSEPEPASAQPPVTPPASDPDPTLFTDPEKDGDHGASSSERDGGMFDFDDLDEAEVHVTPSKQTNSDGPSAPAPMAEPIAPSVSARPVVDPMADPVVEPAPPAAEGPETQPAKAEEVGSQNDDDGLKNPLLRFTTKELLELARSRGVDVRGCVEKSDIVDRLTRPPRAAPPPVPARPSRPAPSRPGIPASKPAAPGPSEFQFRTANSSFQGTAKAPSPIPRRPAKAHATKAVRRPEVPPQSSSPPEAPPLRHPGEIPDGWSARVQTWFGRYPGFSAMLPPEAEMWTDQELDVYFGSNGDIWPRGKRPAWFGRPSTEPDAKSPPKPQGPRVYPDLKVHFQTLDLAETTPPEILRRHYRRLARDIHPDKHPDNVEEATRRFQQVTEAYEAIATRLKL